MFVCPVQEWNISRGELDVLSALGLLSAQDVARSVVSAWNPVTDGSCLYCVLPAFDQAPNHSTMLQGASSWNQAEEAGAQCTQHATCVTDMRSVGWCQVRVGFHGGEDLWVEDVLNIGVDPRYAEWACTLGSPCSDWTSADVSRCTSNGALWM